MMAQHLLSAYGLEYPNNPKKQCAALKKYVVRATEGMASKNDKLMYNILLEFSVETKINNLHNRVSSLLTDNAEEVSVPPWESTTCLVCGTANAKMCSGCMLGRDPTAYCSKACQKLHWPVHKAECKEKMRPWTSEELKMTIPTVIMKMWRRSDISSMTENSVIEVTDAAAHLFHVICIYMLKTTELGMHKVISLPMVPNLVTLPDDHDEYLAEFVKVVSNRLNEGKHTCITCHVDKYMANYRDWKNGNPHF
jgi:hypothetical protein